VHVWRRILDAPQREGLAFMGCMLRLHAADDKTQAGMDDRVIRTAHPLALRPPGAGRASRIATQAKVLLSFFGPRAPSGRRGIVVAT
jgi:hypothetical protein